MPRSISIENRTAMARARLALKDAKEASRENLEGGGQVYKDSPPGVGFVLLFPNGRKLYYRTSDMAKAAWVTTWAKDHMV